MHNRRSSFFVNSCAKADGEFFFLLSDGSPRRFFFFYFLFSFFLLLFPFFSLTCFRLTHTTNTTTTSFFFLLFFLFLFDHRYDNKEKTFQSIVDSQLVCAMAPPGGGRNPMTPRFMRHFSTLCITSFDDMTLDTIFSQIMDWHFRVQKMPPSVGGEFLNSCFSLP